VSQCAITTTRISKKKDIRLLVLEISNKGFWLSAQLYG
jgi:hypothetical protein